jgi:hypothetical protein
MRPMRRINADFFTLPLILFFDSTCFTQPPRTIPGAPVQLQIADGGMRIDKVMSINQFSVRPSPISTPKFSHQLSGVNSQSSVG